MTSSGSLRDSYSKSPSSWSFQTSPSDHSPSPPSSSPSVPKYEWSTRLNTNPVFDLSPSLNGANDDNPVKIHFVIPGIAGSALVNFAGAAFVMPWEVAKVLLQIQWIPRDGGIKAISEEMILEEELSDESSDEAYFQDPTSLTPSRYPAAKLRLADEEGYVVRRSVMEEETRPEYVMPVTNLTGVWSMIKKIARWRNEGWFALWKGLLTTCITNTLSITIQPLFQDFLFSIFPSSLGSAPPSLLIPLTSHLLTGLLLSPLDLVRTRLIAQSSMPRHRTYSGPLNALSQIIQHEGGIRGLYLHPHLLIPAALDNIVRPFANLALPMIVASRLGVNEDSHPVVLILAEIAAGCLANLMVTPVETVRRRLQVQTRGNGKFKACVETRPQGYHGVVDAFWRISTEERSEVPVIVDGRAARSKGKDKAEQGDAGWVTFGGIGQLYHGLGMNTGAVIATSVLTAIAGGQEAEGGWAEL
ncbi:mitochondrial carrier domain-containing protein [Hysterangium stoloniferum]|nr:mitochondrial carrier domain-containing protein [Hysterangium stoloniferum]